MRYEYLNGYGTEYQGCNNPITDKQKSILKAIEIALGETCTAERTKAAWDFIKPYEERIQLAYYTDDKDELPEIYIDGKAVYKYVVPLTDEQELIRGALNYYYDIDIKLNDRYKFQHVISKLKTGLDLQSDYDVYGFDTIRINGQVVRVRNTSLNLDKFGHKCGNDGGYLHCIFRMNLEKDFNSLLYEKYEVSDKLKETPKVLELIEKERKRKEKNKKIKALNAKLKAKKRG